MSWSDPAILKQMQEISTSAPTAPDADQYERVLAELHQVASSADLHAATAAKAILAVTPIIRDLRLSLLELDSQRATGLSLGLVDAIGNVTAALLLSMPKVAHAHIRRRIEQVVTANMEAAPK
jgi:transcription termination factor Rho